MSQNYEKIIMTEITVGIPIPNLVIPTLPKTGLLLVQITGL